MYSERRIRDWSLTQKIVVKLKNWSESCKFNIYIVISNIWKKQGLNRKSFEEDNNSGWRSLANEVIISLT